MVGLWPFKDRAVKLAKAGYLESALIRVTTILSAKRLRPPGATIVLGVAPTTLASARAVACIEASASCLLTRRLAAGRNTGPGP